MHIDLKGKVAVVTGASRGLGRACALALAKAGASVAAVATNETLLTQVCKDIEAAGVQAMALKVDVSVPAEVDRAVDAILSRLGRVDILVNNAGITRDNLFLRMKDEEWDQVMAVNLKGPFNWIRAVGKHMLRQRSGRIINLSSVSGLVGNTGQVNYAASKAGILGLTKSVAKELASRGITCNAVAPGFIQSDMTMALNEAYRQEVAKRIPLGRMGTPEDIAAAVVFLASDAAGYITGQTLVVDGGMQMAF